MAFTEQDIMNQQQEIARLADELGRLNDLLAEQKKSLGLPENEEIVIDESEMTAELEQAMAEAMDAAKREGNARAALARPAATSSTAGRGRRGTLRI